MPWPIQRFRIEGNSMLPTFSPGDRVLISRWGRWRAGDTVVFQKGGMKMVKRLVSRERDVWMVRGDNLSESTDSLEFGSIKDSEIFGKVVMRYFRTSSVSSRQSKFFQ